MQGSLRHQGLQGRRQPGRLQQGRAQVGRGEEARGQAGVPEVVSGDLSKGVVGALMIGKDGNKNLCRDSVVTEL